MQNATLNTLPWTACWLQWQYFTLELACSPGHRCVCMGVCTCENPLSAPIVIFLNLVGGGLFLPTSQACSWLWSCLPSSPSLAADFWGSVFLPLPARTRMKHQTPLCSPRTGSWERSCWGPKSKQCECCWSPAQPLSCSAASLSIAHGVWQAWGPRVLPLPVLFPTACSLADFDFPCGAGMGRSFTSIWPLPWLQVSLYLQIACAFASPIFFPVAPRICLCFVAHTVSQEMLQ